MPAFDGVGDFYRVPRPLAKGDPGALIRVQQLSDAGGQVVSRVMYHSLDSHGKDRAVTGMISYPTVDAPAAGWPVLSWDHGTTGLSQSCAPSRLGAAPPTFGTDGVHVATDYLGLGPVGELHPYLQRITEARATIDIVRAARNLPSAHAGKRWVVVGHSQGGHAALSTGEVAPTYAPELDLIGTVAIAPAAELTRAVPGEAALVPDVVTALGLFGAAADDPTLDVNRFLSPAAQKAQPLIETACLPQLQTFLVQVAVTPGTKILNRNPRDDPVGKRFLALNEVGTVKTISPVLVVSGGRDALVVPARIDLLMERLCHTGDTVERIVLPNDDHGSEPSTAAPQIKAWIDARYAGAKPPTSC